MPTRNVDLTDHLDSFIDGRIASGRFSNASEVMQEALRLLEEREQQDQTRIEWLRNAAKEGFDAAARGDYTVLHSDQEIDNLVDQVRREVTEKLARG